MSFNILKVNQMPLLGRELRGEANWCLVSDLGL
jgi:hypothetical protein